MQSSSSAEHSTHAEGRWLSTTLGSSRSDIKGMDSSWETETENPRSWVETEGLGRGCHRRCVTPSQEGLLRPTQYVEGVRQVVVGSVPLCLNPEKVM